MTQPPRTIVRILPPTGTCCRAAARPRGAAAGKAPSRTVVLAPRLHAVAARAGMAPGRRGGRLAGRQEVVSMLVALERDPLADAPPGAQEVAVLGVREFHEEIVEQGRARAETLDDPVG